jgi:hypothetical protein
MIIRIQRGFYFLLLLQKKAANASMAFERVCPTERKGAHENQPQAFALPAEPCATLLRNLRFALFVDVSPTIIIRKELTAGCLSASTKASTIVL